MLSYGERFSVPVELVGRIHSDSLFTNEALTASLDSPRVRVLGRRATLYWWADADVASLTLSLIPVILGAIPPGAGDPPVYELAAVPVLTAGAWDHDPGTVHTAVRFEIALPSGAEYVCLRAVPAGAERPQVWARLLWHDVPSAVRSVSIAASGTISTAVDLGNMEFVALYMPAAWTVADLNVHASPTPNGTYRPVYNDAGTIATIKVGTDRVVSLDSLALVVAALRYIKLVATVAQVAAAEIILLLKE